MAVRGAGVNPLTLERPSAPAGQVGFGTRFIQKDQLGRVKARLPLTPESARPGDVRTVLLAGAECLFLGSPLFSVELELGQAKLAGCEVKHGDEVGGGTVATGFAFGGAEDAV